MRELGAKRTEAVFWGADPDFFRPYDVEKETDVYFYGYGDKFRREWMQALVGEPSRPLPDVDFSLGGRDFRGDIGSARLSGEVPTSQFARAISAARINLCITRRAHATVYASSSCRPFELASSGAAIVANPYDGIERWFEPGSELVVVSTTEEAIEPTASSSTIRRRRPSSGAEHASACSTSTRTAIARGGCSTCRPPRGSPCRLRTSAASRLSRRTTRSRTSRASSPS